ncbi:MAG: SLBB domain-containing protein [Leptospirillia bacterium]
MPIDPASLWKGATPDQRAAALEAIENSGGTMGGGGKRKDAFGLPSTKVSDGTRPEIGERPMDDTGDAEAAVRYPFFKPAPTIQVADTLLVIRKASEDQQGFVLADDTEPESWTKRRVRVDREGRIRLPGEAPLTVLGWTGEQVAERLSALDFARGYDIEAHLLPRNERFQGMEIAPFGYDLFREAAGRPPDNIPVPKDYVVGPGDTFLVQLFGKKNAQYELGVTRDGTLLLPGFGPFQVAGLPFDEARQMIVTRVREQAIGVEAGVTMGMLRSIQVYVLGEVEQPGLYAVGALGTPMDALFAAGGIVEYGSLRRVLVKRGGKQHAEIDLYDLLLAGDTSRFGRLESRDVVFVPPVDAAVVVSGAVRRPAIYELKGGESVADMIHMAGGMPADANDSAVQLRRIGQGVGRTVRDLGPDERAMKVADGDVVRVFLRSSDPYRAVTVRGHVMEPGVFGWVPGMRLSDLFSGLESLLPNTDLGYVLIARRDGAMPDPIYLQAQLGQALSDPNSAANPRLAEFDEVWVFSTEEERTELLAADVGRLQRRAVAGRVPDRTVEVRGAVRFPGRYPQTHNMRLSDALAAAGDITDQAFIAEAEVTRYFLSEGAERREMKHILVRLDDALRGDPEADIRLVPGDEINIRATPEWQGATVTVSGAVRFPGTYAVEDGATLTDLLDRAGGLTRDAFLTGAVFQRERVRKQEQQELERLARNFEAEMMQIAAKPASFGGDSDQARTLAAGQELLRVLKETKATGRLSLRLKQDRKGDVYVDGEPLKLADGDRLHIPVRPDSVLVMGEVYHPTAHRYEKGGSIRSYIQRSGGINKRGNAKSVLVVHGDGSVTSVKVGKFSSGGKVVLGDTVVVPQKIDTFSSLRFVTDITQILYQLALTAASAKAVGVL